MKGQIVYIGQQVARNQTPAELLGTIAEIMPRKMVTVKMADNEARMVYGLKALTEYKVEQAAS